MKEKMLSIFSIFPALLATLCWGGGLLLATLGLGTAGFAFLSNIAPYRNVFLFLSFLTLFLSYNMVEKKNSKKSNKIIFSISATLVVIILYAPFLLRLITR